MEGEGWEDDGTGLNLIRDVSLYLTLQLGADFCFRRLVFCLHVYINALVCSMQHHIQKFLGKNYHAK